MSWPVDQAALAALPPELQQQARRDLLALERARLANPIEFYRPHAKQQVFHASRAYFKAFLGGNRSGKTTGGIIDDLIQTLPERVVPEHLRRYKRWGLDGQKFFCRLVITDLTKSLDGIILQKVREWCPPDLLVGGSVDSAWHDKMGILSFTNGSFWQIMSNDQDLRKFSGTALHRIHYDEEPREDIRRECLLRLTDFDGDELLTMTPLEGLTWVYDEIFEPWEAGNFDPAELIVVQVDMDENPHLPESAKERVLRGLTPDERRARKQGRFVHFAGLIYGDVFDERRHVIPDIDEVPADALVYETIDPGIGAMAAVLFAYLRKGVEIVVDDDGRPSPREVDELVIFDELPLTNGETVEQIAEAIKLNRKRWEIRPRLTVIDPAARNREQSTGRSVQAAFSKHGIATIPGQNDVLAGIDAVKERFGRPLGLRICASCTTLIAQLKKYRWKTPPRDPESAEAPRPVKRNDHMPDALRYLCMAGPVAPARAPDENLTHHQRMLREHLRRAMNPTVEGITGGPGMLD